MNCPRLSLRTLFFFALSFIPLSALALPYFDNCPGDPDGQRPHCMVASCDYWRVENADQYMRDGNDYTVDFSQQADFYLAFTPANEGTPARHTGFIFIHGGAVDTTAYSGYAAQLAAQGFPSVHIVYDSPINPDNLLCTIAPPGSFDSNTDQALTKIQAYYPRIDQWVFSGHSLGSVVADSYLRSDFAKNRPEVIGFVYMGGYTNPGIRPEAMPDHLQGLLILGGKDGVLNWSSAVDSGPYYPEQTELTCIVGGNHAQFGWYGPQDGDSEADISAADQQQITFETIRDFMIGLDNGDKAKKMKKHKKNNDKFDLTDAISDCQEI